MGIVRDLTVEILKQIRDEIVVTRTDLGAQLSGVESKVESRERRQLDTEVRLATELVAVVRAVDGVRNLLRERLDDRDRIDDHERGLSALERGPRD